MPPRLTAQSRVEELLRVPAWKWPPTCAHTQFRGRPDVAGPSAGRVHPARRAQWTTASWHAETNRQHTRTGCPSGHAVVANHLGGECLRPTTGVFGEHRPATRVRDDTRLKYRRRYLPGVTRRHTKTATCRRLPIRADRTRNSYLARLRGSGPNSWSNPVKPLSLGGGVVPVAEADWLQLMFWLPVLELPWPTCPAGKQARVMEGVLRRPRPSSPPSLSAWAAVPPRSMVAAAAAQMVLILLAGFTRLSLSGG